MQEQKIRFVATLAALVSPYSELPYLQRTLISLILSDSWTQCVRTPCCLALTNHQAAQHAGTKNHKLKVGALICVVETDDGGGVVAALGTEADRNLKLKAAVDQQLATFKT
jgi:hypothetical protein